LVLIFTLFNNTILASIISGGAAALVSYCINSRALKSKGEKVIIYWAPILEELLKTGFALVLRSNVFLSHVTFGAVEAVYDIWAQDSITAYLAGLASFISHGVFGAITQHFIYQGHTFLGIATAVLIHIAWNYVVIKMKNQH